MRGGNGEPFKCGVESAERGMGSHEKAQEAQNRRGNLAARARIKRRGERSDWKAA